MTVPQPVEPLVDEEAARKARKAEKKARKAEKRARREEELKKANGSSDDQTEEVAPVLEKKKKRKVEEAEVNGHEENGDAIKEGKKEKKHKKEQKKEPLPTSAEASAYLEANSITITGDRLVNMFEDALSGQSSERSVSSDSFKPVLKFGDLDLPENLLGVLSAFTAPTPIQACTWPVLLRNRDVIGIARTGSGKTITALSLLRLAGNAAITGQAHLQGRGDLLARTCARARRGSVMRSTRTSTCPPLSLRPRSRALMTRVSLKTSRSPARSRPGRSVN
jgi:flagellar biosynthesis GTPase FlhF